MDLKPVFDGRTLRTGLTEPIFPLYRFRKNGSEKSTRPPADIFGPTNKPIHFFFQSKPRRNRRGVLSATHIGRAIAGGSP